MKGKKQKEARSGPMKKPQDFLRHIRDLMEDRQRQWRLFKLQADEIVRTAQKLEATEETFGEHVLELRLLLALLELNGALDY